MMIRLKVIPFVLLASLFFMVACSPNNSKASPAQTVAIQSTSEYVNPYPAPETNDGSENTDNQGNQSSSNQAYPAPEDNHNLPVVISYPDNFTTGLDVPTPVADEAIVTGQLMKAQEGDQPYISVLFLAPVEASNDPNRAPKINFSRDSNPIAVQDIENGRFVFSEIDPGQYAIVIWSPGGSFFIKDSNGNTLIIEGKSGEVNDLGVILFE